MEASRSVGQRTLADAAFDRVVRDHRVHLERYAVHLGASKEDAEEIAATALLRAYQSPPDITCDREWRAWLSTVTRNIFFDARRRRQVRVVSGDGLLEAVPSMAGTVDQVAAAAQEARQICAAIALLPPAQRAVMYLREVRGYSYEEISDELGLTVKAVTAALHTGRKKLQHDRGGLSGALSAMALSPLALLRRATGAGRSAAAVASTAKIAVPVMLLAGAGAGTAAIVTHNPARPARWSAPPLLVAPPAHPLFAATSPLAAVRRLPTAGSPLPELGTPVAPTPVGRESEPHAVSHATIDAGRGAETSTGAGPPAAASAAAQPSHATGADSTPHAHGGAPVHRGAGRGVGHDGAHPSKGNAPAARAAATSHGNESPGKSAAAAAASAHDHAAPAPHAHAAPPRSAAAAASTAAPAASSVGGAGNPSPPAPAPPASAPGGNAAAAGSAAGSSGAQSPPAASQATPPGPPQPVVAKPPVDHGKSPA